MLTRSSRRRETEHKPAHERKENMTELKALLANATYNEENITVYDPTEMELSKYSDDNEIIAADEWFSEGITDLIDNFIATGNRG